MDDSVSVRRLRERDKARHDGDTLARAVAEYLAGKGDREALGAALSRYASEQGWNGPAAKWVGGTPK